MKIIQITDTHLVPPGERLHTLDPAEQLSRAVQDIAARHPDCDLAVITGDLCNDGDPEAYALLREILSPLPFPVRLMLGNHDARPAFRDAFPDHPCDAAGFVQSFLDTQHGRLLFLDSHEPGMIGGRYCASRRAWLEAALAGAGDKPVTLFIHHPPVPDGIAHFENIRLHDTDRRNKPGRLRVQLRSGLFAPLHHRPGRSGSMVDGWQPVLPDHHDRRTRLPRLRGRSRPAAHRPRGDLRRALTEHTPYRRHVRPNRYSPQTFRAIISAKLLLHHTCG